MQLARPLAAQFTLEAGMLRTLIALVFSGALIATGAWAQDKDKPTAQQQKMKSCNAQASKKDLKGDERKAFMSDCLKGDSAKKKGEGKELTAQQKKMKSCNAQAGKKQLKGDERKAFMSDCQKG
jgi:hypothetical protein